MDKDKKFYVAGHLGLVGSALVRKLQFDGVKQIVTRTRQELELTDRNEVDNFFAAERPDYVFLAAAKVGGILANSTFPADFIRDNLVVQTNMIDAAYRNGTTKLLFLGSSCIYPKLAPQPIKEEYLLTSPLEPTNESYAIAKIAGVKMCQAYRQQYGFDVISVMPTNLYGPHDNFDLAGSHVLPALLRKFHEAKKDNRNSVEIWGTGVPKREFLHVDDLAEACVFLMHRSTHTVTEVAPDSVINIGVGEDISIRELAEMIADVVGFRGGLEFDGSKPDGTPRKLLDVSRINRLGWTATISLKDGINRTYRWFQENLGNAS